MTITIMRTVRIGVFTSSPCCAGPEPGLARNFVTKNTRDPIVIVPAATAKAQYRLYRDCQVSAVGANIASRPCLRRDVRPLRSRFKLSGHTGSRAQALVRWSVPDYRLFNIASFMWQSAHAVYYGGLVGSGKSC